MFNGGVYNHSNAAHNLLSTMRVGVIRGGCEVEIWKRAQKESGEYVRDESGQRIIRAGQQVTKIPAFGHLGVSHRNSFRTINTIYLYIHVTERCCSPERTFD